MGLLDGPLGIGKSLLAARVVALLATVSCTIRFGTAQESAALVGSSEFRGVSKPGLLFQTLIYGDHASPVFVLEEMEKASSAHEFDPLAPMYELLEADSGKTFHDRAMPWLGIDCSSVVYIACCNHADQLLAPIASRMRVFDIAAPTQQQSLGIAHSLWRDLMQEWPVATAGLQLTTAAWEVVASHAPASE